MITTLVGMVGLAIIVTAPEGTTAKTFGVGLTLLALGRALTELDGPTQNYQFNRP